MDLKTQVIQEYLTQGGGFRRLADKYGIVGSPFLVHFKSRIFHVNLLGVV
jgi:transposase-like protein